MSSKKESVARTLTVALLVCLVCSVVVSAAAVALKPVQTTNRLQDKQRNILQIAGLYDESRSIEEQFSQITPRLVDLRTGEFSDAQDPLTFDQQKASKDPDMSQQLTGEQDIASIRRRADYSTVYVVENTDGSIKTLILPIHGYGLWSTLYGFMALESDLQTVVGLGFYQHAETPGLGGEVDNPNWKAQWQGKVVYDESGDVDISVIKGSVDPNSPKAEHQVDGLAGATLTSRGVESLVRFWLGEDGFGPFLDHLRAGEA
ncbi:MAG: Na(+)-translocating NADH-quinone reductase subunit C [Pseudomonadales bacterium]|jgi:Na+-transporting NADH:ubiquinone oxidoreductase subunit C|uniref:Na(+)-translocating NADH-quinone reductase subunit C n=1 Tax=Halopseudomonas pachastrellae TaxID=254161 RepID=A0A1S8DIK5_9GAMM|nr:Na(+)-translocating NADH-quinone reductase subunit C [Halopseudomonas pachastrellae]MAB42833.1 Na(+)-translocating NADH-quinone reductase subunit C [Pseudomonadales bacterium]MAP30328.1 Na(+)-translocating NADH-quinone reductase subunit C [Pseudomonas sp.]MAQ50280.1 Na(+)-translocating NADH-quinone reductase subunit C [Pseudomonas sp.]MBB49998.1 Na(+)-translocating NADH-quinone reductase subunit C [Pseudomonadales bacterium]MBF79122.1 Na(+)-translocating NADH-quinone reductase subunit C [Ps|tara:strand:+ start:587 stop:1366 length:780 start_codon:yes stop_codon:yes gene_type:complete